MRDIRLGLVNLNPIYDDLERCLGGILAWCERAAAQRVGLLVFPEGILNGYDLAAKERNAIATDHPALLRLRDAVIRLGLIVSVGYLERSPDGFHVAQRFLGSDVDLNYRKSHLTGWDAQHCRAGDSLDVQRLGAITTGTQICYDSAFAEASRTLVERGAELLLSPTSHGMGSAEATDKPFALRQRQRHVAKYWGARAYDLSTYTAYVNQSGETTHGEWFPGYLGVWGPDGELIAEFLGDHETLLIADLRPEPLARCRRDRVGHFFTMKDRRPELYGR